MWDSNSFYRLNALLINPLLRLPVVRKTFHLCVAACCEWVATTLVEWLFSHHAMVLWTFLLLLYVSLVVYSVKFIFHETFDSELKNPVPGWKATMRAGARPHADDETAELPARDKRPPVSKLTGGLPGALPPAKATGTPAQPKSMTVRLREKSPRRPPSKAGTDDSDSSLIPRPAPRPRRAAPQGKSQPQEG